MATIREVVVGEWYFLEKYGYYVKCTRKALDIISCSEKIKNLVYIADSRDVFSESFEPFRRVELSEIDAFLPEDHPEKAPLYVECVKSAEPNSSCTEVGKVYKVVNWHHSSADCMLEGAEHGSAYKGRFKKTTKEAYDNQNNKLKPIYEDGSWYRFALHKNNKYIYARYDEPKSSPNYFVSSGYIDDAGNYADSWVIYISTIRCVEGIDVTDPNIQKSLPSGHIQKLTDIPKNKFFGHTLKDGDWCSFYYGSMYIQYAKYKTDERAEVFCSDNVIQKDGKFFTLARCFSIDNIRDFTLVNVTDPGLQKLLPDDHTDKEATRTIGIGENLIPGNWYSYLDKRTNRLVFCKVQPFKSGGSTLVCTEKIEGGKLSTGVFRLSVELISELMHVVTTRHEIQAYLPIGHEDRLSMISMDIPVPVDAPDIAPDIASMLEEGPVCTHNFKKGDIVHLTKNSPIATCFSIGDVLVVSHIDSVCAQYQCKRLTDNLEQHVDESQIQLSLQDIDTTAKERITPPQAPVIPTDINTCDIHMNITIPKTSIVPRQIVIEDIVNIKL
jgi:hypothetical protein